MILFVASDLVWSSRIKATADAAGVSARRVFGADGLSEALVGGTVRLVLIDLEADEAPAIINALRGPGASEEARATPALAWAPHVMVEAMESARAAGIERVMARGAFANRLDSIVAGA